MTVKATREGLQGQTTASGWHITDQVPYVALPSRAALYMQVRVRNPLTDQSCIARVLDVGPHFTDDDSYVFADQRPRAESVSNTNGAGIDLGEFVWHSIGMKDNTQVEWSFL